MSIEMSRPKQRSCCSQASGKMAVPPIPCSPCDGSAPPTMAYAMSLACTGNNTCGSCGMFGKPNNGFGNGSYSGSSRSGSSGGGSGGCKENVQCFRLPGQGPCDPPCFSTMIFPRFAPFVGEPKCAPSSLESPACVDACSMAPVGGSSMIGAHYRSCFSCNTCNSGNGSRMDVCNRPQPGAYNHPCFATRKSNSCSGSSW